jgi:hypothetical protein
LGTQSSEIAAPDFNATEPDAFVWLVVFLDTSTPQGQRNGQFQIQLETTHAIHAKGGCELRRSRQASKQDVHQSVPRPTLLRREGKGWQASLFDERRSVIEDLVVDDRTELQPNRNTEYTAFCDVSGGRGDDAALAIAHRDRRTVVLDYLKRYRPPFNPLEAVEDMVKELRRYRVRRITAASGSPTRIVFGSAPAETSTSTSTGTASMPTSE